MKMEDIQFSSVIISNDSNKIKINSYRNNYFKYNLAGKLIAAGFSKQTLEELIELKLMALEIKGYSNFGKACHSLYP
jgi:hypothetical protein